MIGTEAAVAAKPKPLELDAKLERSSKSSEKIDEVELAALREEFPSPNLVVPLFKGQKMPW